MARHRVSVMVPSLLHPEIGARNGRLPSAPVFARLARAYNQVSTRQRKLILMKWQDFRHMENGAGASVFVWPFYFRTGENVTAISIQLGVTRTDFAFSTPIPRVVVNVLDTSLVLVSSKQFNYVGSASGTVIGPDDVHFLGFVVDGLAPNTEYVSGFSCEGGLRLAYAMVEEKREREADDSVSVICNPSLYVREGPIAAAHLADLANAGKLLWRHNASHLLSWCPNYVSDLPAPDVPNINSTSYVDLIANSAAVLINTPNRGTLQRPNAIPVKMAVRYRLVGSGTADFRLFDGTNSIQILAAPSTGTATWITGTGTMSGAAATWRMQARVSVGTITVRIMGWSLFQFES
jgi:hypothetical protein